MTLSQLLEVVSDHKVATAVTLCIGIVLILYWWLTRNYGVFEAQGIFSLKPSLFFGNTKDMILERTSVVDFHIDYYQQTKGHK